MNDATPLPPSRRLRTAALALLALGLGVTVGFILYFDAAEIGRLMLGLGFGILLVAAFHMLPLLATALSWRTLLLTLGIDHPAWRLWWMRMVADSINQLLPAAQIGGEVARAHLMIRRGDVSASSVAASIVVDLTLGFLALVLFILAGLAVFLTSGGAAGRIAEISLGVAAFAALLGVIYFLQRAGAARWLAALSGRIASGERLDRLAGGMQKLDEKLGRLYRNRGAILRATGWRILAWYLGAAQIWLILWLLGHPVTLFEALILEAVGQAARNAGFAIPGGLGAQEAGYVVGGALIGLPAEAALAMSLTKRARDLVIGLPALVSWQWVLGRGLIRDRDRHG